MGALAAVHVSGSAPAFGPCGLWFRPEFVSSMGKSRGAGNIQTVTNGPSLASKWAGAPLA